MCVPDLIRSPLTVRRSPRYRLTMDMQKLFMSGRLPDDITIALRDPNVLAPLLPLVEQRTEVVKLGT